MCHMLVQLLRICQARRKHCVQVAGLKDTPFPLISQNALARHLANRMDVLMVVAGCEHLDVLH